MHKLIKFTLQDAPDYWTSFEAELQTDLEKYGLQGENEIALLINRTFPQLQKYQRRIKKLQISDESGNYYETNDFDIPGSLIKKDMTL